MLMNISSLFFYQISSNEDLRIFDTSNYTRNKPRVHFLVFKVLQFSYDLLSVVLILKQVNQPIV